MMTETGHTDSEKADGTTDDPAADHVGEVIESKFTNHNVNAFLMDSRYSDAEHVHDSADWGVVCQDCGRAEDFHIVPGGSGMESDTEFRVSPVYVESLEERVCEPYELPEDVNTGDHTLHIADVDPAGNRSRHVHCEDCGRTTIATSNPEYAGNYIDTLGTFPCQSEFTDEELMGAVLYASIPEYPDATEVGISNWNYDGGNGKGRNINGVWKHSDSGIVLVRKSRGGRRWIEIQSGDFPDERINTRHGSVQYESRESDDPSPEPVMDILAFMQEVDGMDEDCMANLERVTEDPVQHILDSATLTRDIQN